MVTRRDCRHDRPRRRAGRSALRGRRLGRSALPIAPSRRPRNIAAQTITIVWEAGLQSLDPLNFSGPKWEELTGIKVKVVEVPTAEMFTKIMQEYRAGTGAYDALNVIPAWMPDLAQAGALEVLDPYVDKYGFRDELQKIAPTYRDNQMTVNGKIYGFPDDGDVFVMYYRKDIFARPDAARRRSRRSTATTCAAQDLEGVRRDRPVPHRQAQAAKASMAPRSSASRPTRMFMFQERFRNEGGKFFDADTMKATINSPMSASRCSPTCATRTSSCRRASSSAASSRTSRSSCRARRR